MRVYEAIEKRASIRDYQETVVPEDKLNRVLEAARLAPTGGNRQEVKFVVVKLNEFRDISWLFLLILHQDLVIIGANATAATFNL